MRFLIITTTLEHFDEDAFGRDGHGHASKSKETLYKTYVKVISEQYEFLAYISLLAKTQRSFFYFCVDYGFI
jgi:hypothetical protein